MRTKTGVPASGTAGRGKPRSEACEAIHSAALALHVAGAINKTTMREFDLTCLEPPTMTAQDVKRIRAGLQVSQEVLARYLGITKSTVAKWESAVKTPSPMAQRLLAAIEKHGLEILI